MAYDMTAAEWVELYGGPRDGERVPLFVLPYPHEVYIQGSGEVVLKGGTSVSVVEFARYVGPYRHPGRDHLRYEFAPEPCP